MRAAAWSGLVYRGLRPAWSFNPVSGDGTRRYGGRFNPPGVAALYTATTMAAAWREAQQGFAHDQPITMCAYRVDCADILDLTNDKIRRQSGIALADLACPWGGIADNKKTPPSWAIARNLISQGIAGIVVPSFAVGAADKDTNIVFWDWSERAPHQVVLIDDENRLRGWPHDIARIKNHPP